MICCCGCMDWEHMGAVGHCRKCGVLRCAKVHPREGRHPFPWLFAAFVTGAVISCWAFVQVAVHLLSATIAVDAKTKNQEDIWSKK